MQNIIKSRLRYLIVAGFFGGCIHLIYLAIPVYMMIVYDKVLISFSKPTLYTLSLCVLISLLVAGVLDYLRLRILGQAGNNLVQKMMPLMLKHIQADAAGVIRKGYDRGMQDLEKVRNAVARGHLFDMINLPWVLIYVGILFFIHPLIGIVAFGGIFMGILFQVLLRRLIKKQYIQADEDFQATVDFSGTCCHKAEVVSGMGMAPAVIKICQDRYQKILTEKSSADSFQAGIGAVVRTVYGITLAAVFGAGVWVFFKHELTAGAVFAGVMIAVRLFYHFEKNLLEMKASIDAEAAWLRLKTMGLSGEQKDLLSLPVPEGKLDAQGITLMLNAKAIVHNISFSLNPGETLGIIGPSFSGKTSLCKVLLGIWPMTAGKVRLDGAEISLWPQDELGRYTGYLPQEPELFPAGIAENIARLGEVDSDKIIQAAKKAGVHEMILKLPQGYDTPVQGKNLAVGQRQLISLARALYGDPKLVILDEPQTHLDDLGQKALLTALNHLKQERVTTVVVTDRSSLLPAMDKILVIKEGQMSLYGPAREVIDQLANRQQPKQAAGV